MEPQYIFMQNAGLLDSKLDYRFVWYFDALNLIDSIVKNPEITEELKRRPREVRQQIIDKMGTEDEVRSRTFSLRDPLELHIKENNLYEEIRTTGEMMMKKKQ